MDAEPEQILLAEAERRDELALTDEVERLAVLGTFDPAAELRRLIEDRDPGIIFETTSRVVVIEEHSGELRYFAGGWRSHESRIHLEQDRIWAEGSELGVFPSDQDAVRFAERFLARQQALQDIETPRLVHHRHAKQRIADSAADKARLAQRGHDLHGLGRCHPAMLRRVELHDSLIALRRRARLTTIAAVAPQIS